MRSIMYVICTIIGHIFAKVTYFLTNLPSGILIFNSSRASVFKKENFCLRILIERSIIVFFIVATILQPTVQNLN